MTGTSETTLFTHPVEFSLVVSNTHNEDLDLFAVYETTEGSAGIVYFSDLGNLESFPFIALEEEGIGEEPEKMTVSGFEGMERVWICCWDYEAVASARESSEFAGRRHVAWRDGDGRKGQIPIQCNAPVNTAVLSAFNRVPSGSVMLKIAPVRGFMLEGLNPPNLLSSLREMGQAGEGD